MMLWEGLDREGPLALLGWIGREISLEDYLVKLWIKDKWRLV